MTNWINPILDIGPPRTNPSPRTRQPSTMASPNWWCIPTMPVQWLWLIDWKKFESKFYFYFWFFFFLFSVFCFLFSVFCFFFPLTKSNKWNNPRSLSSHVFCTTFGKKLFVWSSRRLHLDQKCWCWSVFFFFSFLFSVKICSFFCEAEEETKEKEGSKGQSNQNQNITSK